MLFYFRFPEPYYAAARVTLMALDAVSLIRAGIPDGENQWIKDTASMYQLWEASLSLLKRWNILSRPVKLFRNQIRLAILNVSSGGGAIARR